MSASPKVPLEPGKCYHIFNRGNNRRLIFGATAEYERFLYNLEKYINPVADIHAYALLPDHFHTLVTIKQVAEWPIALQNKPGILARSFGHLQNAHAQFYLARHKEQKSSLFERSFERILVDDVAYFKNLVLYLHKNPHKHGQALRYKDYPWTSYHSLMKEAEDTFLEKESVWSAFGGRANFIAAHEKLDQWLWDDISAEF